MNHYEGLVFRTAQLLVTGEHPECKGRGVEDEEDDVRQKLRLKVHYAIRKFDPSKVRATRLKTGGIPRYGSVSAIDRARDSYVNMCVRDCAKDIAKKKRRGEMLIEDIAPVRDGATNARDSAPRDKFEQRYLSTDHETEFASVEDEFPSLPNTLSSREREVLILMYRDYRQVEIAVVLGITKREVESAVRGVRVKLADWKPTSKVKESVPLVD